MPRRQPADDLLPFQRRQIAFAAHLRDPERHPPPDDVETRRVAVYREVLFNNINALLSNGFPVLRKISPDDVWNARIRRFFADHASRTPYFPEVGAEFVDWVVNERGTDTDDPPFIGELAHYEWMEIAVWTSDADESLPEIDHNGDLLTGIPVLSPVALPLCYAYPVHRIGPDYQPRKPPDAPTYLVVHRDRLGQVHFLEINAVTYRLLELLTHDEDAMTGHDAIEQIVAELAHPDPDRVRTHGATLLDDLRARHVIVGTQPGSASTGRHDPDPE